MRKSASRRRPAATWGEPTPCGRLGGLIDVAAPDGHGGGYPGGGGHDGPGLVPLGLAERLAEQRPQLRAGVGVVEGEQDGQGVDPLGQVLAGRLAELLVGGDDVEDVVAQLEEHAEAAPEGGEGLDLGRGAPPVRAPMRHEVAMRAAVLPAMAPK